MLPRYVAAASNVSWDDSLTELADIIKYDLIPKGINQGEIYGLATRDHTNQLEFLNKCDDVGFKVIYPLGTGPVTINRGGPFDKPALLEDLKNNVSLVKDHPAILGYYMRALRRLFGSSSLPFFERSPPSSSARVDLRRPPRV